jgi:L-ascorbate metabolism protein UlaG (beta-lactamase superfamily)
MPEPERGNDGEGGLLLTTTLDWYGCATFRLSTAGLTIFLDAYIDRAPIAKGSGLRADDIDAADWIVVGHSHFDHLYGAERIAANTGARIIGSYETVRVMEQAGVPLEQMICVGGGETVDLGNGVKVSAYPSQHSCVWSHGQMSPADEVCIGDLGLSWQEQRARFEELVKYLTTELDPACIQHLVGCQQGDRGDGGALLYVFDTPDGRLLFQDTSGHWSGILGTLRPDVAILAAAGRGNVDGEPIQGSLAQFVARQAELLQPRRLVLCHHDDWLPGFSIDTEVGPIAAALAQAVPDTELVELGYVDGTPILPVA